MSKVILVTGTSTGLGISISIQAAQAGHTVYATMRNLDKRAALDAAATKAGVALKVLQLDVQDTASVNAAVDQVVQTEGRIDVLVNNAGAGMARSLEQATEEDVQWVMDVNFMGVVRCTKAVLPHMRAQRSGHVVTISSVGGLVGQPFHEIYCAAKFAVEGFHEAQACYITPNFGIQFTLVEPGGIATEFAPNVLQHIEQTGGILEDEYQPILMQYITKAQSRMGGDIYQTADEVAAVVMTSLTAEHPPLRVRTSDWSERFCDIKTSADPDGTKLPQQVYAELVQI